MQRILYDEPDVTGVPPSLLPVVRQCLDKDPGRRPSARDVLLRLVDPSARQPQATRADSGAGVMLADPVPTHVPHGTVPPEPYHPAPGTGPVSVLTGPTGPTDTAGPAVPTGPPWPAPVPARSRRGPVLAVCAAIVTAALIIGGVLLTRASPPASPSTSGQHSTPATGRTSTSTNTQASPSPPQGGAAARIPPEFAGTWTGTATMTALSGGGVALTSPITFTFVTGATTIHEVNEGCVNTLTLTGRASTVLTFTEPQVPGQCQAGTVTFSRHGAGLSYRWVDIAGQAQNTAILHKAGG
jgi:hypothetical protein